jgi:hypothetical protein
MAGIWEQLKVVSHVNFSAGSGVVCLLPVMFGVSSWLANYTGLCVLLEHKPLQPWLAP